MKNKLKYIYEIIKLIAGAILSPVTASILFLFLAFVEKDGTKSMTCLVASIGFTILVAIDRLEKRMTKVQETMDEYLFEDAEDSEE